MRNLTDPGSNRKALGERMKLAMRGCHTQESLAVAIPMSLSGLKKWLSGESDPAWSNIVAAAAACGVSLDWLATGEGEMRPAETASAQIIVAEGLDDETFGELYAAIARLYRERGVRIGDKDFGALVSEKAGEIAAANTDPAARRVMIPLIVTQLDKELRSATGTTVKGKRLA